jgi:pyruvate ferredoxin oxidoreductase gamma subunit
MEIRWHGRAGQGAKTASQLYALAMLRRGAWVQAFPEYGPERSGAPMRAYTRIDDRPVRRRYGITEPDAVVVLDPSLVREVDVADGLAAGGLLLVNSDDALDGAICIPASRIAAGGHVNVVMAGALAAALGEPSLDELAAAARELFGAKKAAAAGASVTAIEAGWRAAEEALCPA